MTLKLQQTRGKKAHYMVKPLQQQSAPAAIKADYTPEQKLAAATNAKEGLIAKINAIQNEAGIDAYMQEHQVTLGKLQSGYSELYE